MNITSNDNISKMKRHRDTLALGVTVFCARCGSHRLDQNSADTLRCYDCDNTAPWDGTRFGVRRPGWGEDDVADAFRAASRRAENPSSELFPQRD